MINRALAMLLPTLFLAWPASAEENPFWFGSYGRLGVSSDAEGGRGRDSEIVPFGPRLTEGSYLELDFGYQAWRDTDAQVDSVITIAFGDRFFHYDGRWDVALAIRQAYLEARDIAGEGTFVWVGSRMYRGDDIYLLDMWPMDELNTMGAAVGWRGPRSELALHGGFTRPDNDLQFERITVQRLPFGTADAVFLDRQRTIVSAKAEQRWPGSTGGEDGALGMKLRLYAEFHHLPAGERTVDGRPSSTEPLPDDLGWLVGVQGGLWNFGRNGHLNVWLRYASGLAAYGPFGEVFGLNRDRRAVDASEYRLAVSGNYESDGFGIMFGGYARAFFDADGQDEDFDDRVETVVVARPMLHIGRYFTPGVEASFQTSRSNGLNPRTKAQQVATVTQISAIPALTFGPAPVGSYSRPQLRLIYAISFLNEAALALYPAEDPRASQDVVHFIGVGAEWWFGRGGGY